ncbi:MAG: hypothetical protein ACK5O7_07330 [Holosporales bacterium]
MRYIPLLAIASVAGVAGCYQTNTPWNMDCKTNYSVDSREYDQCKDRVSKHQEATKGGSVSLDPGNVNRPGEENIAKDRETDGR